MPITVVGRKCLVSIIFSCYYQAYKFLEIVPSHISVINRHMFFMPTTEICDGTLSKSNNLQKSFFCQWMSKKKKLI